ncbi:MAG TPA: TonB-dependent receptor, partial [Novosphingobium sp.]|nr:TonB-dependent receptor [Novosphingobium sp.]
MARSLVLAVILGFAGAGAAPAFAAPAPAAEEPANTGLAEITVTARRKEEKLETVPFAVTAFSAAALSAQDTKSLTDIAHNTPGFQFQQQAGGGSGRNDRTISNLTFRGLFLGNVSPVSQGGLVFLDGAPVINAQFPAMDDIARVEVLKGPQSVYFGRSTFTGAINFVTKDPGFEFGGHLKAMYGTYGSNELSASLNVPVVKDVLAVRIAGSHVYKGGQYHNYANPNEVFGSQKTDSVSLDVLFKPTDALRIKGYFSYQLQDDGPPAQASIKPGEMNCNMGGTYGAYWCGTLPSSIAPSAISGNYGLTAYAQNQLIGNPNKYVTIFNPNFLQHGGMKREVWQADVRADYSFGNGMTLTSITAMHSDKTGSILDLDFRDASNVANPYYGVIPGATANVWWLLEYQALVHDFSQEIRLTSKQNSRFRWTVGGNYFWTDYLSGVIYGINPYGGGFSATYAQANPQTPAIFGAAYFDVTPQLTISAEARYQWDKVRQASLSNSSGVALNPPVRFGKTYTSFSPRVTIDYKFTPSSTAYALWSRGYRPGGFNTALAIQSDTIKNQILATGGSIAYDQ